MSLLRNRHRESKLTFARVLTIVCLFTCIFSALVMRVYQLQVIQHDKLLSLSNNNKTKTVTLMPYRADIVDRNKKPIAIYRPNFYLSRTNHQANPIENDLKILKNLEKFGIYNLAESDLNKKLTISQDAYAYLNNHPTPSLTVKKQNIRHYPYPEAFAHLVGFTNKSPSSGRQYPDSRIAYMDGKAGIELVYDKYISGLPGSKLNLIDAKQQIYESIIETPPKRAIPLQLTIDLDLQNYAYDQLSGAVGSVIMLNPKNGEVLAAVSSPSFNTNSLNYLNQSSQGAMFNRFLQALYPPASIVKPFIALNALEEEMIDPAREIHDPGYYLVNDQSKPFRNYKRTGHGNVNLKKAIAVSNDTYFYALAHQLGIAKITGYLEKFGFGKKTNISLPGEAAGIIPNKQYRDQHYKTWFTGQTIITGIGQGDLLCTPLQIARATMLLANDGYDYPLHLIESNVLPSPKILNFKKAHRERIIDAMVSVPISGTARRIGITPYELAAKTGSAQVASLNDQSSYHSLPKHQKDHHLFIGFAPAYSPEVVLVVVVEHQLGATEIAKNILDWYWAKGKFTKNS